jgi:hypothetical protein
MLVNKLRMAAAPVWSWVDNGHAIRSGKRGASWAARQPVRKSAYQTAGSGCRAFQSQKKEATAEIDRNVSETAYAANEMTERTADVADSCDEGVFGKLINERTTRPLAALWTTCQAILL